MWLAQVRRTLSQRGLLPPRARVLVALSGGPDSAGLLLALSTLAPELGLELRAASIDHGLRPEAKDDVAVAAEQAKRVGLSLQSAALKLEPGADLQARARTARYQALFEIARTEHCDRVAVGHTQDDQAETVLARILRGASIRGLRGIHAARDDGVVRPLIDLPAAEVHAAVAEAGWPVVHDPSNALLTFQRVRLRRELLPALVEESPGAVRHLAELADDAAHAHELIEAMATGVLGAARLPDEPAIRIEPLRRAPIAVRREVLALACTELANARPSRAQLLELELLLRGRGEVTLARGAKVSVDPEKGALCFAAPPDVQPSERGDKDL